MIGIKTLPYFKILTQYLYGSGGNVTVSTLKMESASRVQILGESVAFTSAYDHRRGLQSRDVSADLNNC